MLILPDAHICGILATGEDGRVMCSLRSFPAGLEQSVSSCEIVLTEYCRGVHVNFTLDEYHYLKLNLHLVSRFSTPLGHSSSNLYHMAMGFCDGRVFVYYSA
jgi:hypothetical protein